MIARITHRCAVLFAVSLVLLYAPLVVGYADEPALYEVVSVKAPYAMLTIYEVVPGKEVDFLDAMIRTGPYNIMNPVVTNEKILQPLPSSGQTVFFSISRHYNKSAAEAVLAERDVAIRPLLTRKPTFIQATLVEHMLADWSWERGTQASSLRVLDKGWATDLQASTLSVRSASSDDVFKKFISSLAFFKSGYCGQVGMLEFYPAGTSMDQIRTDIGSRQGFSGASIFSLGKEKGFAVYCEFFKGPSRAEKQTFLSQAKATGNHLTGSQAGMVVQNYRPR